MYSPRGGGEPTLYSLNGCKGSIPRGGVNPKLDLVKFADSCIPRVSG